ncbi:MAG TPA: hypothetical protein VF940_00745 [Streptosporangiaceae bacterium]
MSATTGGRPDDQGTSGRAPSIHTGGKMQTEMLHGDVVHSRSGHDLAIATAWSVADVEAVDDCIRVES